MDWPARVAIAIVVVVILGAGALAIYAGSIPPPHHTYEQVIPSNRFTG